MAVTDTSDVPEICVKSQQQQDQTEQSATALQPQALRAEFTTAILAEREVSEMMKAVHITEIPEYYVHPESVKLRQQSDSMVESDIAENCLPVIDLAASREDSVRDIGKACGCGFFQIINHGICPGLIEKIAAELKEFFSLPLEEKIRCSTPQKVAGPIHFGGGSKGDWRDGLKINIEPASAVAMDYWPVHPVGFRETLLQYVAQNKALVKGLLHRETFWICTYGLSEMHHKLGFIGVKIFYTQLRTRDRIYT